MPIHQTTTPSAYTANATPIPEGALASATRASPFGIGGFGQKFDPEGELESNENLRKGIRLCKTKIEELAGASNAGAQAKARHYLRALDAQLLVCDETEEEIRMLSSFIAGPHQ